MAMTWTLWCRFGLVAPFWWSELKEVKVNPHSRFWKTSAKITKMAF